MNSLAALLEQARKIDEGVASLSSKWHNPTSIGLGTNARIRIDALHRTLDTHEEVLNSIMSSLDETLTNVKKMNNQKEESLIQITSEINKIEEVGMNHGFNIPNDIDTNWGVSPIRSPAEEVMPLETPIRSNLSRLSIYTPNK